MHLSIHVILLLLCCWTTTIWKVQATQTSTSFIKRSSWTIGKISCGLLATVLTVTPVEAAETTLNKAYILGAKQALDVISASIADDSANVKKTYADIEFVLTSYRLKDRLPLMAGEATTLDHQMCVNEYSKKTLDNLVTISEYFSISNDGRSKVMIADAVPNQKLNFIRQGLSATRSNLQLVIFCAN